MEKNERLIAFFQSEEYEKYFPSKNKSAKRNRIVYGLSGNIPNDLYVQTYGLEHCLPNKRPTMGKKTLNSFHYVESGEGFYEIDGETIPIGAGTVFVSCADVRTSYYPNPKNPWSYVYFSLGGILQSSIVEQLGFTPRKCLLDAKNNPEIEKKFMKIYESSMNSGEKSLQTVAALYDLLAALETLNVQAPSKQGKDRYVLQAINFIKNNFLDITVNDIAESCAVSPAYLTRICKEVLGISLKEVITASRIYIARDHLIYTDIGIKDIANSIGYADKKHFIRVFKSIFGVTPSEYRKNIWTVEESDWIYTK